MCLLTSIIGLTNAAVDTTPARKMHKLFCKLAAECKNAGLPNIQLEAEKNEKPLENDKLWKPWENPVGEGFSPVHVAHALCALNSLKTSVNADPDADMHVAVLE